jgi:hypothetical protein
MTSEETELRKIVQALGLRRGAIIVHFDGGGWLQHEFEVSPEDFLQQAEDDFESGGNASRLNALSSAKRAIFSQIDEALAALGFNATKLNFPQKMQLLGDLGFTSPRILKRVNDARNILEHEYRVPSPEQVEEAIDLAALFVGATQRHMMWWDSLRIGNEDQQVGESLFINVLTAEFKHEAKVFSLTGYKGVSSEPGEYGLHTLRGAECVGTVQLAAGQALFSDVVRLVLSEGREKKRREALSKLFSRLEIA